MRGQKALRTGWEQCGTENFLFTYTLLSGSSLHGAKHEVTCCNVNTTC